MAIRLQIRGSISGTSFNFGHKFSGGIWLLAVDDIVCLLVDDDDLLLSNEPESSVYVVFELLSVIELSGVAAAAAELLLDSL